MNRHWTLDELTDRVYGIREAGAEASIEEEAHLASCAECSARLEELHWKRAASAQLPEVSGAELAAQRRAILERVVAPQRRIPVWVPALTAAASLLAIAILVEHPHKAATEDATTAAATSANAAADAQLFSDVYNIEESAEPLAAAPIHGLFEETQP